MMTGEQPFPPTCFHWVGTTSFTIKPAAAQQFEPDSLRQLYPTENALRQKQKKAEGHVVRHRKKYVEQHQDCGENFDILQIDIADTAEANETEQSAGEQALHDLACLAVGNSSLQDYGSDVQDPPKAWISSVSSYDIASIFYHRAKFDDQIIDCMKMFGGAGTTIFLLVIYYGLENWSEL